MILLPRRDRVTESRFGGPYSIVKRIDKVNYEISKPNHPRKTLVHHVNRLKPYFQEEKEVADWKKTTCLEGGAKDSHVHEVEPRVASGGRKVGLC